MCAFYSMSNAQPTRATDIVEMEQALAFDQPIESKVREQTSCCRLSNPRRACL